MTIYSLAAVLALMATPAHAAGPLLEVRNIGIGATQDQVLTAAKQFSMRVIRNSARDWDLFDPNATGQVKTNGNTVRGRGLRLGLGFTNGKVGGMLISEEGDINGQVLEDLNKKWGNQTGAVKECSALSGVGTIRRAQRPDTAPGTGRGWKSLESKRPQLRTLAFQCKAKG